MNGQLSTHFVAAGTLEDLSSVSVEGNIDELEVKSADAVLRLSRPATFGYDGTRAAIGQLQLEAGNFTIEALGEIGQELGVARITAAKYLARALEHCRTAHESQSKGAL